MKKSILFFIALFAFCSLAEAQYGPRATYRFLNIPISAQAAALGGVPISLIEANPAQMHANPAFLNSSTSGSVSATWARYLSEVDMGNISGAYHRPGIGTFGVGLRYLNYGDFEQIDASGNNLGSFSANDFALKLAFAREYLDLIQYGIGVDLIHSSYESFTSSGFGVSGGVIVNLADEQTSFGLSFVNLGSQFTTYDGTPENLPFDLRAGVSRKLQYLPLRLSLTAHSLHRWDMTTPNDTEEPGFASNFFRHLTIGGEFLFSDNFHFRLGYNQYLHDELKTDRRIDLAGFGFGVGITVKSIGFEISRTSYSEMGHLLQLGLQTRF
ncbi:MAG: type IX secretion system protein PorQ [Balneolales bacterium]|nr:type IX secretion system protein PorQ [Balneolales bacterium]